MQNANQGSAFGSITMGLAAVILIPLGLILGILHLFVTLIIHFVFAFIAVPLFLFSFLIKAKPARNTNSNVDYRGDGNISGTEAERKAAFMREFMAGKCPGA